MKDGNDRRRKFWARASPTEDGCWIWTGALRANGYGSYAVRPGGRWTYTTAHRHAYKELVGPVPFGYEIDHLCRNRACLRPDHLEAVTIAENRRRRDIRYAPDIDRTPRPLPVIPPPPPVPPRRNPATHCPNGHDKRVVGTVKNGKNITCAACRADQVARKRKGGAHGTETHCPHGHEYTEENTYRRRGGSRECKTCVRARNRAAHRRRAASKRSI